MGVNLETCFDYKLWPFNYFFIKLFTISVGVILTQKSSLPNVANYLSIDTLCILVLKYCIAKSLASMAD